MMLSQAAIIYYKSQYGALVNYKTEKIEGKRYCPRVTRNPTWTRVESNPGLPGDRTQE
jgi:hypothetical protein